MKTELPLYVCHKEVRALKIKNIVYSDVGAALEPVDRDYADVQVPMDYLHRHAPQSGGYYVVYTDGYTSYSPEQPFEAGYVLKV